MIERSVLALQILQVAFLLLHDWIPLGRFNDRAALRRLDPTGKIVLGTAINTVPFSLGLVFSLAHLQDPRWPGWVWNYLLVSYAILFFGELNSWWIPYFGRAQPARAARYRLLFGKTRALLPERNGIRPNTLHLLLHVTTLLTVLLLCWSRFRG